MGAPIVITDCSTAHDSMRLRSVVKRLETEHPEGLTSTEMFLSSRDLLPVPPEEKTWGYFSFVREICSAIGSHRADTSGIFLDR